jgi:hypothetical protein
MAHYAKINNGVVEAVIVASQDVIDSGAFGNPNDWLQTSYNTRGGVHILGGEPFRMNYATVGGTYDVYRDAFIPPKPYASWVFNETTCLWDAPTEKPNDGKLYGWDEITQVWRAVE